MYLFTEIVSLQVWLDPEAKGCHQASVLPSLPLGPFSISVTHPKQAFLHREGLARDTPGWHLLLPQPPWEECTFPLVVPLNLSELLLNQMSISKTS